MIDTKLWIMNYEFSFGSRFDIFCLLHAGKNKSQTKMLRIKLLVILGKPQFFWKGSCFAK